MISRRSSADGSPLSSPNTSPYEQISIKISKDSPKLTTHVMSTGENIQLEDNEKIAQIVRQNMAEFGQSTNLEALSLHLFATNLISASDYEELKGIMNSHGRMNYFYIMLLPKKGKQAYKKLFECLKKETSHRGHYDLVHMIETGLRLKD